MAYKSVVLEDSVTINRIISVHYFQYMSDFSFPGESHDFWELVCVDRGEIDALAGDRRLTLKKGNILFHKPNEFHNVLTNGKVSPSLVVIGFECHSPAIKSFEDQLMSVQDTEKELMAQIIVEARNTFSGRLDDPYQEELIFNSEPLTFGSAQLISHYLEQLMIHLYRRYFSYPLPVRTNHLLPAKPGTGKTVYIMDEPTTGLHVDDVHKLVKVIDRLVEAGNTVIIIEHNLDVIKRADHIIDLGPEGGNAGGMIVAQGTPEEVALCEASYTGQYLRPMLPRPESGAAAPVEKKRTRRKKTE